MSNPTPSPEHVTLLLEAVSAGDSRAAEDLLPLVYEQLRRLAKNHLSKEAPGQTLQPTALVHEAYLKLVGGASVEWADRGHFFAAAALAMRRILVDRARERKRLKRGGGKARAQLQEDAVAAEEGTTDLLALDEALGQLEKTDRRRYDVVMLRYFAGLTIEETAAALNVAPATVKTDWALARVQLYRAMSADGSGPAERDA
ncbi:MAG: sigma-70 family RNA polymerase sigma factor [Phycisphaerales bacterium]|nr:sigma-70 family RNA polymerase sigma factor [Phycisphaerales bacterium]